VDLSQIDCTEVLRRLELYVDGELEAGFCVEIEEHLVSCGSCTDHSDFHRKLKDVLRAKCGCHDVPAHIRERIRLVIEREFPHL
jgi:mycothiol system anti-sigma-R factor